MTIRCPNIFLNTHVITRANKQCLLKCPQQKTWLNFQEFFFYRGQLVVFIIDNDFTQYRSLTQHSIYLLFVK